MNERHEFSEIISVDFDPAAIMARINKKKSRADFALGTQVLTDSNFYCKEDTKTLIDSSIINSSDDLTLIQWTQYDYARLQYYLPAARKDKNPNATWKWFETAKANHLKEWIKLYGKALREDG